MVTPSSDCGRARRVLWPGPGPQPATPEVAGARAHLGDCPACASFFGEMTDLAAALRDQASRMTAPLEVRDRIFQSLARERAYAAGRPRRSTTFGIGAAAALLLIASAVFLVTNRRDGGADIVKAFVVEHTTMLTGERLAASDRDSVLSWLSSRVPFAVDVPVLTSTRLRGARLAVIEGGRGAVVEYETGGVPVSYYVVPAEEQSASSTAFLALRRGVAAGYPVVLWRSPGAVHAFVGNVPVAVLERFARECMKQASTA
jgi:anti-sigma factor RsiW